MNHFQHLLDISREQKSNNSLVGEPSREIGRQPANNKNMNPNPTMTPREQRDLLFAIREQDAPSPYTLAVNGTIETDTIDKHFTLCEADMDLLAALIKCDDAGLFDLNTSRKIGISDEARLAASAAIAKAKGGK